MICVCESYAKLHHIHFNPTKSKLLCFNTNAFPIGPIFLNNQQITIVTCDKHLGNYISNDIYDRNIDGQVCAFYQRSHAIINDFRVIFCNSVTLDALHRTYCMHMYGCELWNLTDKKLIHFVFCLEEN